MLRDFTPKDTRYLIQWANTPEELFRFSGETWSYPLNSKEILEYIHAHQERYQFIFEQDEIAIGFGELILHDTDTPRLSRLIINKANRGRGLGKQMIQELVNKSKCILPLEEIYLFVLQDNKKALHCYEACGFKILDNETYSLNFNNTLHPILKMKKKLL